MDENYLDNLLNEFSLDKEIDNKIEDELDEQLQKEKDDIISEQSVSREESFNMDLELDAQGGAQDTDIDFSEDQINELDQLDNFADLDMSDLDFSDIDFDDLDVTKLSDDILDTDFDSLLKDFDGDFEIPSFSDDAGSDMNKEDSLDQLFEDNVEKSDELNDVTDSGNEEQDIDEDAANLNGDNGDSEDVENTDDLNEDNFDADSFLDSLLDENSSDDADNSSEKNQESSSAEELSDNESSEEISDESSDTDSNEETDDANELGSLDDLLDDSLSSENNADNNEASGDDDISEDDLFSMLDLDEQGDNTDKSEEGGDNGSDANDLSNVGLDTSDVDGLQDIQDISEKPKKKKKTFMEILFGEPDEDDEPTEEELKAIEEKKAAKKAKKEADAEKKKAKAEKDKAEKSKKDADKKRADAEKKKIKAEKKAKKKAEKDAEAANAEPEKELNKPMVIFIFSLFLGGVGFFYLSTVDFNYKLAIEHAANYFASQKYHKAYDEIKGVEVKEKDKELKERIYTVMYVERLYEGYENNIQLGRQKKALDSLLRGVDKYYEYYDEAKELDIVSDLDFSFAQIQNALQQNYGITVERALEINNMDDYEYMKTIEEYIGDEEEE